MIESEASHPTRAPAPVSPTMLFVLQARTVQERLESELAALGLSLRRFGLLGHLHREPGMSFSALARRGGLKVQSLHPIIDAMLAEGFVETVGGVGQGRAAEIRLTADGERALERATAMVHDLDQTLFEPPLWAELGAALTRMGEAFVRERTGGRSPQ